MYPDIILNKDFQRIEIILRNISSNYLYKDVFEFESLKKPELLIKLLQALALQI
jgi:hypothetical protein